MDSDEKWMNALDMIIGYVVQMYIVVNAKRIAL